MNSNIPAEVWQYFQNTMNYTDDEMKIFKEQPRTSQIISRLEALTKVPVVFEVVESHGCIVGHKEGDSYLFPNGGAMDTKNSSPILCPFLMPPMSRIMWILQERVWEGLSPLPLFATGQCDDVGLKCNGWGKVIVEAKIMDLTELETELT